MKYLCILALLVSLCTSQLSAQRQQSTDSLTWKRVSRNHNISFLQSDNAARIARQVMAYQRVTGGWPKNINFARLMTPAEIASVQADYDRIDDSTTDNNATTREMIFLARMYNANGNDEYRQAVMRGIEYLLSGQYDNGGWPQFWPENKGYAKHITYNDDAMANTLLLLCQVRDNEEPFQGIADTNLRQRVTAAIDKAVECILNTQIKYDGELTVWCQQHYSDTFLPAPARAFELPSFCSAESASLVSILMDVENPDQRVIDAVHAAIRWFDRYKLTGLSIRRTFNEREGMNTELVADSAAKHPLWARYYDLTNCEPFVCDRDGIPRRHLTDIGFERRNGYSWYNAKPLELNLFEKYDKWADRYDKAHKVAIDLNGPGANVTGLIDMDRRPQVCISDFDAIVAPGQSINEAIRQAPGDSKTPYKILLRKGDYNEKVIIDRPNIVLVGEHRDSTVITYAEGRNTPKAYDTDGNELARGVISIYPQADDCVISGITVYNNYGSTVEATTSHQFGIFGRATRTIIINSNIRSDGNDALALWAQGGDGMYYHADLDLWCPGVDFMCPRGWCYATRCNFYGDSRAMIWHDGRGDINKKLVITCSTFDAASPTLLGRYHHDSQFYLANCKMSANVLDANISYAYTDKVLDPCPWGQRVYYWGCVRDGGDSGWLRNNLSEAPDSPQYHTLTARWTFDDRWDPEKHIRELWSVLAY